MLGPSLRGNLISLEPARPEDAALRQQWFADLDVTGMYDPPGVPSLKQVEEWFDRNARDESLYLWRIDCRGETIGHAVLNHIDRPDRQARTGMVIGDRSQWGKGYGSEVVRLRTAFALGELGLERIETCSLVENVGMHRALERSGFRRIGTRTHSSYFQGVWHDEYIFELVRSDWLAQSRVPEQP